jgi:SAM-dependent methyltransferase
MMSEGNSKRAAEQLFNCPLCRSDSSPFADGKYRSCHHCKGIFLPPDLHPDPEQELTVYRAHNNVVTDLRYQRFVSPITSAVLQEFTPEHIGLDFGAGTGPVISHVLKEKGYSILQYDPYFHPDTDLLNRTYDYIACCEVMEHFFYPVKEFTLLRKLLKPKGALFCMTHIFREGIEFENWYYRTDPTHVFIYREETLEWIKEFFKFSKVDIHKRLVCFWD